MIAAKKPDGNIRLCIDPRYLNLALKRSHYPLPVIEEILQELSEAKVFSKVDLKQGFLQVELDEESSKLTVFQTPWSHYRFHRIHFGITPAPEIFQMKLDQNLEGLKGVFKITDDSGALARAAGARSGAPYGNPQEGVINLGLGANVDIDVEKIRGVRPS